MPGAGAPAGGRGAARESDEDEPPAKSVKAPTLKAPPKLKLLSNTHSPFPKAPPKAADEEDSDDGFESPATPSEEEDDE